MGQRAERRAQLKTESTEVVMTPGASWSLDSGAWFDVAPGEKRLFELLGTVPNDEDVATIRRMHLDPGGHDFIQARRHTKVDVPGCSKRLKQAQQLQAKMLKMQEELTERTEEGTAGGGMIVNMSFIISDRFPGLSPVKGDTRNGFHIVYFIYINYLYIYTVYVNKQNIER